MKGLLTIVRRDLLERLKSQPDRTALVPSVDIHAGAPIGVLKWPFIKSGPPRMRPRKAACLDAGDVTMALHAFSRGRLNSSEQMIETAEDHAAHIGSEIERAIDGKGGPVYDADGRPGYVRYALMDINLMPDGSENGAYHWFANVRGRVTAS